MKTKYLYHGSIKKLKGKSLIPRKPQDIEENQDNLHKAVYATNIKDVAIAMAIISCKGVYGARLKFSKKPYGIIYDGWPRQEYIYIYTLPPDTFKQTGKINKQWVSFKSVKPIKVKRISVKNNLNLIRKATKKEVNMWCKKYGFDLWEEKLK
ncbi:MAG: hypothetical protein ABIB79_00410 [archaeon]